MTDTPHVPPLMVEAITRAADTLGDPLIDALSGPDAPADLPPFDRRAAQQALRLALQARIFAYHHRPDGAGRWLRTGLAAARLLGEATHESAMLNSLGLWHHAGEEPQQALAYFDSALAVAEAEGDTANVATTLTNVGQTHLASGQPARALDPFRRAEAIYADGENHPRRANVLHLSGHALRDGGQHQEALESYQDSLDIARAHGTPQDTAAVLSSLATFLHDTPSLGRPGEAIPLLEEAIALLEGLDASRVTDDTLADLRHHLATWRDTD